MKNMYAPVKRDGKTYKNALLFSQLKVVSSITVNGPHDRTVTDTVEVPFYGQLTREDIGRVRTVIDRSNFGGDETLVLSIDPIRKVVVYKTTIKNEVA